MGLLRQAGLWVQIKALIKSLKLRIFLDLISVLPPSLCVLTAFVWIRHARLHGAPILEKWHASVLGLFFALTFLPFLKIFKEQVHLAYCLVPASIFVAASLEAFWRSGPRVGVAGRVAFASVLVVAGADHLLNLFVVRDFTRQSYAAIGRVGEFCNRTMPAGSTLLSNAHHTHDVRLYCQGRFDCYDTSVTSGRKSLFVGDPETLDTLLENVGPSALYCLDVRLPATKDQPGFDRVHWVVRDRPVELEHFGEIERVAYRYPVLDPLKLFMPTRNVTWPGSPDLEFDYYRGPALDGSIFMREVAVRYDFYMVTGRHVHQSVKTALR